LHDGDEIAAVDLRDEANRRLAEFIETEGQHAGVDDEHQHRDAHHPSSQPAIALCKAVEADVKQAEETVDRPLPPAIRAARSEEGKKLVAQAHKVVTSPEARKLLEQAKRAAGRVSETAKAPENAHRLDQFKRAVRSRLR